MKAVRLLGVPLRSGSLYPGSEHDAKGYRDIGIVDVLRRSGTAAFDDGDLEIPDFLPHHFIPPIRNWPGPRIVWDLIRARLEHYLQHPDQLPILLGCDCSIVVGTAQALRKHGAVHVIYIDGDFDDAPPDPSTTRSGAALAAWLLTNPSPFCTETLRPEDVTVVGWTKGPFTGKTNVGSIPLAELHKQGPAKSIEALLRRVPHDAKILIHFDIDVVRDQDLPAAYFPHDEGLTLAETEEILDSAIKDPRVSLIEISEYSILRDTHRQSATKIAELLAHALARREQ